MLKLILYIIICVKFFSFSFANERNYNNFSCKWENKNKIPCVEIVSQIPNSSNISKKVINKTIITKKQIEESGAVDLIDVLNTLPDINITQSGPKGQQASMFMRELAQIIH